MKLTRRLQIFQNATAWFTATLLIAHIQPVIHSCPGPRLSSKSDSMFKALKNQRLGAASFGMSPGECCSQVNKICLGSLTQRVFSFPQQEPRSSLSWFQSGGTLWQTTSRPCESFYSSAGPAIQRFSARHMVEETMVLLVLPLCRLRVRKIMNYGTSEFYI